MPTVTIDCPTEAERLLLEQALAYLTHLRQVARSAPDGTVLAACEQAALQHGRAFLRDSLATALQQRVAEAEQKGGPPGSAPRRTPGAPRAATRAPS